MRRTQVYLTEEQLRALNRSARRERASMAQLVRDAVDAYLRREERVSPEAALDATFGASPDIEVPPRSEWRERDG